MNNAEWKTKNEEREILHSSFFILHYFALSLRHYTNNNSIMAEIKSEETSEKKSLNFIEQIVENDSIVDEYTEFANDWIMIYNNIIFIFRNRSYYKKYLPSQNLQSPDTPLQNILYSISSFNIPVALPSQPCPALRYNRTKPYKTDGGLKWKHLLRLSTSYGHGWSLHSFGVNRSKNRFARLHSPLPGW